MKQIALWTMVFGLIAVAPAPAQEHAEKAAEKAEEKAGEHWNRPASTAAWRSGSGPISRFWPGDWDIWSVRMRDLLRRPYAADP